MKRRNWTEPEVQELADWRQLNQATVKQTADHFKLNDKTLYAMLARRGLQKVKLPKKAKKQTKRAKFIDIHTPTAAESFSTQTKNQVTVIRCSPDQLPQILKGLNQ